MHTKYKHTILSFTTVKIYTNLLQRNLIKTYAHTLYMVAFTVEGNVNKYKDEVLILYHLSH